MKLFQVKKFNSLHSKKIFFRKNSGTEIISKDLISSLNNADFKPKKCFFFYQFL